MFTEIKKTIPTCNDIYIQANFIGSALPPIKLNGILIEAELNIHPALMCFKHNSSQMIKTNKDMISKNKVKKVDIILDKNIYSISIDTKKLNL